MSEAYNLELRNKVLNVGKELGLDLKQGVYVMFSGPTYETPAEVRMAKIMGGDAVGMSTVPEVIVANQQIAGNSLTKNESFRFEYRSGSIENITITNPKTFLGTKGIQNHICNILEGGKEAFIARKNKYTNL